MKMDSQSMRSNISKWLPRVPKDLEKWFEEAFGLSMKMAKLSRLIAVHLKNAEQGGVCDETVRKTQVFTNDCLKIRRDFGH